MWSYGHPHTHDKCPSPRPRGRRLSRDEFYRSIIAYAERDLLQFGPIESFKTKPSGNSKRPS
ncbi:hypothetical protein BDV93DRAFT_558193 [Ceratobasidium sp. AG-I]|nr:hypothetical protein BDV93DRAFT_558193 [Ceratobasidium sp. AG-I]